MRHLAPVLALLAILPPEATVFAQAKFTPAPLRLEIPFEAAWNGMLLTLLEKDFEILNQDRGQGSIRSNFREYSSGPLTESHIGKIGDIPKLVDGEWMSVKYQYEVIVELIAERETVLTVYANIEALKREFLGAENWTPIETSGKLEVELLNQFGKSLFGEAFSLPDREEAYRDKAPVPLRQPLERIPSVVGPERIP
ncbi:MAG: hypothetical protein V3R94_01185 [Acidobacteriota bacterium]